MTLVHSGKLLINTMISSLHTGFGKLMIIQNMRIIIYPVSAQVVRERGDEGSPELRAE